MAGSSSVRTSDGSIESRTGAGLPKVNPSTSELPPPPPVDGGFVTRIS